MARSKKTITERIGDKIADVADHVLHPHSHEDGVQSSEDSTEESSESTSGDPVTMSEDLPKFAKFKKGN